MAELGLEHALGMAGINLDERGAPVVTDANTPANTRPAEPVSVEQPAASPSPSTATESDPNAERMSLDETINALIGESGPERETAAPSTEVQQPEQPQAQDGPPLSEREIALQQERDQLLAEKEQARIESQVETIQDAYDQKWDAGQEFWLKTVPDRVRAAVAERNGSELDVARAMVVVKEKHGQWNAQFLLNERDDVRLNPETYKAPDLITQLITDNGLAEDDRAALQKFASQPEVMKEMAATLGSRIAAIRQREGQATVAANQQVAAHLQGGLAPGAPAVSPAKLPYKFQGGDRNREEAEAFSRALRSGALRARP